MNSPEDPLSRPDTTLRDTTITVPDEVPVVPPDPDTLQAPAPDNTDESISRERPPERTSSQNQGKQVYFSSRDSLRFVARAPRQAFLYGNADVSSDLGRLTAGEIMLDLDKNEMSAQAGIPGDTLSEPVLERGSDRIRSQRIAYNYQTDKGKFDVARISMDQGNVIGTQVKRTAPHVIFVEDGMYSTCELDHPHFYIRAHRMKVVDEDEIFFTRARLYILDIPYPLIFPFGYVPSGITRRQSGILEPTFTYQDQQRRGLGLQNLGWFQYFSDYLTGTASFDIFTSGSYYIDSRLNYSRTGRYTGSLTLGYSRDQGLESTDPDFSRTIQRQLAWNHRQTINPYSNFSANINLRTQDFYRVNSYDIDDRAEVTTFSNLSYNFNQPEGRYTVSVASRYNQNFATNATTLTGPDVNFSMRRITPFQRSGPASASSWYESINIQYRSNFQSRYNFRPLDPDSEIGFFEALFNPSKHREATGDFRHINTGIRHNASVNAQLLSRNSITLSSSISLNEYWYPQTVRKEWNAEEARVETFMQSGFAAGRDFQTSISANTTIYGISQTRIGRFQSFRHTFRPSLSFSYRPDFSESFWGYYRTVQSNADGATQKYSIFEGGIVGGPGSGRQQSLGLTLSNVLEAKEVRRDSTGERNERNVRLIDQFNLNASYNFAADNFNLSDLNASFSTSFIQNLNLRANAVFSFYDTDDDGNRIDRYLWQDSGKFLRMTSFSLTARTEFRSDGGMRGRFEPSHTHFPKHYDPLDQTQFHPVDQALLHGRVERIDVPWSVSLNFNYSWRELPGGNSRKTAVLNAQNIQVRLTPEWQAGTQIGYDFIEKKLTPSQFNVTRNLHCWDLTFQWNPFSDFKFFLFRLTVRDTRLQGLFQKLPGLNNLERRSGTIGRF
ncbi:putative LPS assembly protein LptD [Balneolaceae bacterium ANBcel3]|nr:putative LPS assembly protein LptD [Balneolaceae bacterium ANBcel3]